jgi:transposase
MRYGLMSNVRRSWSIVGKRTVVQNQQEYANRYLYTAIDPINGESFHLMGFDDAKTEQTDIFLTQLQQQFNDDHLIIVWDRAPFHTPKRLQRDNMTLIPLPSYSPQLNPVERFFGEVRKFTANRIFYRGIELLEQVIEKAIIAWSDTKKLKQLTGYQWILEQWRWVSDSMVVRL